MNIIEVKNLVKKYKKAPTAAVNDISFSVTEGEFFSFLGPNGAGKTTTISILTTTLAKTSGAVTIAGHDIDKKASEVRSQIGVIFQNPSLDLNLTGEENIRFHTVLYKMYGFKPAFKLMPKEYQNKVLELSELLGIRQEIFKPVKTFSGGMKRKLEIMRTLMHKPKVLFLDEPTSGLDPLSRKNLWEYLKEVRRQENTTIFLTTHYLEEAEDSDRVSIISKGQIVLNDSIKSIRQSLSNHIYVESPNLADITTDLTTKGLKVWPVDGGLNINFKPGEAQSIIQSIKYPLTRINIAQPSVEDVYLDLIKEADE